MTRWFGESTCDICKQPIKGVLYDAATHMGPWGTLCAPCWAQHTDKQLGTGHGQRYEQMQDDGIFVKVAG